MHVWYPGSSPALLLQNYIIFGKHNLFWDWDKTAVCYFDVDSWEGRTLLAAHSSSRGSHDNKDYHNIGMASSKGLYRIGRLVQPVVLIQAGPSTTSSAANCSALDELSTVYFAWRTLYLSITTGKVRHEQHLYELPRWQLVGCLSNESVTILPFSSTVSHHVSTCCLSCSTWSLSRWFCSRSQLDTSELSSSTRAERYLRTCSWKALTLRSPAPHTLPTLSKMYWGKSTT